MITSEQHKQNLFNTELSVVDELYNNIEKSLQKGSTYIRIVDDEYDILNYNKTLRKYLQNKLAKYGWKFKVKTDVFSGSRITVLYYIKLKPISEHWWKFW